MIGRPVADTIAAVATPSGRGGVGIVRVSGPLAAHVAKELTGRLPQPRHAVYCRFRGREGEVIDHGIALFFQAPHSFTGEDVLELQGHGGPVVMDLLMGRVLSLGARAARPGEFSERAFLNDRIDLAQAEAIADLIESRSAQAARSAVRSLEGEFSRRIRHLVRGLTDVRVYVEAALDFPDEEIDFLADESVARRLSALLGELESIRRGARQGVLLREGLRLVIAGRPNAGKSTLLNRLAAREAAIISEIPGTTRDTIHQDILIDGIPLRVIDTAGLRQSDDPVEREGVRRAWNEIREADLILLIIDAGAGFGDPERRILARLPGHADVLRVWNKTDLAPVQPGPDELAICASTGEGLDALRSRITEIAGATHAEEGVFIARRRHLQALDRAVGALTSAMDQLRSSLAGELAAEDLRLAQHALGEITGEFTSEDLLGEIFSSFCIGK